jgi:cell division septum initiation protein DivIVA
MTELRKISDRLLLHEFRPIKMGSFFNGGRDVYDALSVDKFLNEVGYSVQDLENDLEALAAQTQALSEDRKSRMTLQTETQEAKTQEIPQDLEEAYEDLRKQKIQYERKERAVMELMIQAEEQSDAIREKARREVDEEVEKAKAQVRAMLSDAANKRDEMLAEAHRQKEEVERQTKQLFEVRQDVEKEIENYAVTLKRFANSIEDLSRKSS